MNIVQKLEAAHYAASDKDIETLARIASDGTQAGGTYLRVLVASVQAELRGTADARPRRGRPRKQQATGAASPLEVFERVNTRLYESVKRGLAGIPDADINRRATFARTAGSTLRRWIAAGGNPASLTLSQITKRSLAVRVDADEGWRRSLQSFMRGAERAGPDAIRAAIEALEDLIEEEPAPAPRIQVQTSKLERTRVPSAAH